MSGRGGTFTVYVTLWNASELPSMKLEPEAVEATPRSFGSTTGAWEVCPRVKQVCGLFTHVQQPSSTPRAHKPPPHGPHVGYRLEAHIQVPHVVVGALALSVDGERCGRRALSVDKLRVDHGGIVAAVVGVGLNSEVNGPLGTPLRDPRVVDGIGILREGHVVWDPFECRPGIRPRCSHRC